MPSLLVIQEKYIFISRSRSIVYINTYLKPFKVWRLDINGYLAIYYIGLSIVQPAKYRSSNGQYGHNSQTMGCTNWCWNIYTSGMCLIWNAKCTVEHVLWSFLAKISLSYDYFFIDFTIVEPITLLHTVVHVRPLQQNVWAWSSIKIGTWDLISLAFGKHV